MTLHISGYHQRHSTHLMRDAINMQSVVAIRGTPHTLPGTIFARLNCPPILSDASYNVTRWPRLAAVVAKARPAGPVGKR